MDATTDSFDTREQFAAAVAEAKNAAAAYYDTDLLVMSDSEFDALFDQIKSAKAEHPDWDDEGVLTAVAAGASTGGALTHPQPMLSLDKTTEPAEIAAFCATIPGPVTVELKLDGNAVRASYSEGRLVALASRGDGTTGEPLDRTLNISGLPQHIDLPGDLTVTGEVYMSDADFQRSNSNRIASGKAGFAKPRNAASGVLRRHTTTFEAFLSFAAYDAYGHPSVDTIDDYGQRMATLGGHGIRTVQALQTDLGLGAPAVNDADRVRQRIDVMHAQRMSLPIGIDGAVVKAMSYDLRTRLGAATRHPKWAIAFKFPPLEATSRLAGIEVGVGRTGQMTLRGVLDPPVNLDGSTVRHATLHNPKFVADQNLGIGSKTLITLQGDVIPRCVALGDQDDVTPWTPPSACPQCGELWDTSQVRWRCHTPACSTAAALTYFASRDAMDIERLGPTICEALVDAGLVANVADLYGLTVDQLARVPLGDTAGGGRTVGAANAAEIVAAIEGSKTQSLNRVITALGVRMTGRSVGRWLAAHFRTMAALQAASVDEIAQIERLGTVKAQSIVDGLNQLADVIARLAAYGVNMEVADTGGDKRLAGKTFVVSGSVPGFTRTTIHERIEELGGKASSSVSANTTALVTDETGTSKARRAAQLGTPVISTSDFASMIN